MIYNTENILDTMFESIDVSNISDIDPETHIMIETESNWNNMMMNIGISELSEVENGTVLNEAGAPAFLEKIGAAIKKAWESVVAFFKKLITTVTSFFRSNDSFVKHYAKALKDLTVPSGFSYKGYKYNNPNLNGFTSLIDDVDKFVSSSIGFGFNDIDKDKDKETFAADYKSKLDNFDRTKFNNSLRAKVLDVSGEVNADEFDKKLFAYFRSGSTETTTISDINISEYTKHVSEASGCDEMAKSMLAKTRSSVNFSLKKIDQIKAYVSKSGVSADNSSAMMKACRVQSTCYTDAMNIINKVYGALIKSYTERAHAYKSVLTKLLANSKNTKDDKSVKESFGLSHMDPFANLDLV